MEAHNGVVLLSYGAMLRARLERADLPAAPGALPITVLLPARSRRRMMAAVS